MIVAIDGYSWLKKTYIAEKIAKRLDMDFFSTGLWVRLVAYEYLNKLDDGIPEREALSLALKELKYCGNESINYEMLRSKEVEKTLKKVVGFPMVLPAVGEKIVECSKNRNIVLDGRRSFEWIHSLDIGFYFFSSVENRAKLLRKVKGISIKEALDYINYRDSFEVKVNVPNWIIRIDPFDYEEDILIDFMITEVMKQNGRNRD